MISYENESVYWSKAKKIEAGVMSGVRNHGLYDYT